MGTGVLLKEIVQRLERYKPTSLSVHDDTVNFEAGPMRWVLTTNILVAISRGTVRLAKHGTEITISYELRFNEIVLAGSLISFFLAYNSPMRLVPHSVVFIVFWLFLVGGNYLLSVHWFRDFLRKALKDVTSKPASTTPITVEK